MAVQSVVHPTAETLSAFNIGALADAERVAVESHIATCDACCSKLASLSEDRLVGLVRQAAVEMPATSAMLDVPDGPPELVGHERYQIISQLGVGGMGVVYKAEDRFMGRTVALKVVARRYTANPAALERFRREVRAAAKLNHQNIVTAHDTGEANGIHFLVMEFVEGISLDRLVQKKGPLPIATACQCIRQAAHGLQHAFEQKMVHRDIKPHNLMVTRKGQIKVLDFGLARVAAEAELPPLPSGTPQPDRTVTSPSLVMGTPDYLAPEQARNAHNVDIRADIYALGCVFFFLLTGKPPFARYGTALEKMIAHVQDDPPPVRKLRPDVPVEIADIVARMLSKNPADRFATPSDVASAIKPFARSEAVIDDAPEIVDTPRTEPMVEVPTEPVAVAETNVAPRPRIKRKKNKKRQRRRLMWPYVIAGSTAAIVVGIIGLIIAFGGGGRDRGTEPGGGGVVGSGAAKPVLFVVPRRGLYYPDFDPVRERLKEGGVQVVTASTTTDECELEGAPPNAVVKPRINVTSAKASEYSAILFCGRNISDYMGGPHQLGYREVDRLLTEAKQERKLVIGGICMGQGILLKHGSLTGKKVAPCPSITNLDASMYSKNGVSLDDVGVTRDGLLITASRPEDAVPFADLILATLKK